MTPIDFKNYTLRPFEPSDEALVLSLRNQDFVRKSMRNSEIISPEAHHEWFTETLRSPEREFFMFIEHHEPAGVIGFFDIKNDTANWTLYLAHGNNPKGLGTVMCILALESFFEKHPVSRIETCVLLDNEKSLCLHKKLGFDIISTNDKSVELKLERSIWDEQKHKENLIQ